MTARPPSKIKRRVGRPRKAPAQSLAALLQTPERDFQIYRFFTAYRVAHPRSSKDAAIAATEDKFDCSRSAVQRRVTRLEKWMPVIDEGVKMLRGVEPTKPPIRIDLTRYKGLTERLAAFYSPDEVAELSSRLGAPIALKIAQEREELQALRALQKRARKKTAR